MRDAPLIRKGEARRGIKAREVQLAKNGRNDVCDGTNGQSKQARERKGSLGRSNTWMKEGEMW